jgi:hypothetical protein
MALVYDKPQLWLRVMDKLLEGGAQTRGAKVLVEYVDCLVEAYEKRFVRTGSAEDIPVEELKKKIASTR